MHAEPQQFVPFSQIYNRQIRWALVVSVSVTCRAGRDRIDRVLLWAEKLRAGLWAGLLSFYCQLELEVTITDVVNLGQSPCDIGMD